VTRKNLERPSWPRSRAFSATHVKTVWHSKVCEAEVCQMVWASATHVKTVCHSKVCEAEVCQMVWAWVALRFSVNKDETSEVCLKTNNRWLGFYILGTPRFAPVCKKKEVFQAFPFLTFFFSLWIDKNILKNNGSLEKEKKVNRKKWL
jgi:hypothetical protein